MASSNRTDRQPGHRGAFEKAKKKILKTQTICALCGKPVDFSLKYPHPMSPSVDHIIPVSRGGHPSDISNLQLTHRSCNGRKSDKLVDNRNVPTDIDRVIPNDILELHNDWENFKGKK